MKINKEHLEEVGNLVDIDPSDIKKNKSKKRHGYLIFYFIQSFVFLLSSLLGYLFVLWEKSKASGYPYTNFPRYTTLGTISLLTLHGGNTGYGYFHKKRYNLRFVEAYPAIFVNLIVSFVAFFLIYKALYQSTPNFGVTTLYGVFEKRKVKIFRKIAK